MSLYIKQGGMLPTRLLIQVKTTVQDAKRSPQFRPFVSITPYLRFHRCARLREANKAAGSTPEKLKVTFQTGLGHRDEEGP